MAYKLDPRIQSGLTMLILVILFVTLSPSIGSAQTKATFTPRISVSETYDDNIDLDPDNEESDWITVVSPGANLQLETQHTQFSLDYEFGFSFYLQNSSEDTIRHQGQISWDQQLAQYLSLNLNNNFTRSEDPVTEEDGRITDIASERDVQYRNTGEISLAGQFGPEDLLTAGYRNHLLDSRADQTEDSRANEGFLSLDTWFVPQFGIGLTSSYARWEFQQSKDFTGDATEDFHLYQAGLTMNYRWRPQQLAYARYSVVYRNADDEIGTDSEDYIVHQPALGLSMSFGPNTSLGAEAGYFLQDPDDGDNEEGFVFNGNLNTRRERASFNLTSNTGYDLDYGTSDNQGFSKFSDNSARVDYELSENLGVFGTARYRWEDFTETNRTDHTYGGRAGLRYTFRRWLTASLEGGHLRRDSNDDAEEFTDNRVTLRITTSYPIPVFGE
jgi:hypothetical protein